MNKEREKKKANDGTKSWNVTMKLRTCYDHEIGGHWWHNLPPARVMIVRLGFRSVFFKVYEN